MIKVLRAAGLIYVGKEISRAEEVYLDGDCLDEDKYGVVVLNERGWNEVKKTLRLIAEICETFEKPDLSIQFFEMCETDDPLSQQSFYLALSFFEKAFETSSVLLLEPDAHAHYERLEYFGEEVFEAFPTVASEITNCGSCFALRQYTASVFHALRALELPLSRMAQTFGVKEFKNWNTALNEIEAMVRSRENASLVDDWESRKDFYTDAINHLFAIKNAWRNYTMHLKLRFNREECEEVIVSVRAFMRKAAQVVPENS